MSNHNSPRPTFHAGAKEDTIADLRREILYVRDSYRRTKSESDRRYHEDLMRELRTLTRDDE